MLFLLMLLSLLQAGAAPTTDIHDRVDSAALAIQDQCTDIHTCRTIGHIVWSCISTIFACTWVAVHPNIPGPASEDPEWRRIARRAKIMLYAIFAPDLITTWALRQRLGARAIEQGFKKHGWTKTHGHFVQMGGFMLWVNGKPSHMLLEQELHRRVENRSITLPDITKDDIDDKSKSDALSKGVAVLQTSWFVVQCIARAVERLPLTELEIVTFSFAVLNLLTYILWWDKPLNVTCAVPVHELEQDQEPMSPWLEAAETSVDTLEFTPRLFGLKLILPAFDRLLAGRTMETSARRVPTFYGPAIWVRRPDSFRRSSTVGWRVFVTSSAIGTAFGAIHLIAWSSHFPSVAEQYLWRVSSLVIISVPFGIFVALHLRRRYSNMAYAASTWLLAVGYWILPAIYLLARILLLALAITPLRDLPPLAYQDTDWKSFIPHF